MRAAANRVVVAACLSLAAVLSGCAGSMGRPGSAAILFEQAVPLCTVIQHPEPYVGKRVLVRGHVTETPHGRQFWDDSCERGDLPFNISLARADGLLDTLHRYSLQSERRPPEIPAVFSGILTDHHPALYCHLICGYLSLDDAQLEAVRRR